MTPALLRAYVVPRWSRAGVLALLLAAMTGLELASPQIARRFVDGATSGAPWAALAVLASAYIGAAAMTQVVGLFEAYFANDLGWRATNALRADLARHVLDLDASYLEAHNAGDLIERVDGDVSALANFFSRFVLRLLGSALLLVGALVLLTWEDWRVGLLFLGTSILALVVIDRVRNAGSLLAIERRQANAEMIGFLEERLAGLVDILSNGAQRHALARFADRVLAVTVASRRTFLMGGVLGSATGAILAIGTIAAMALGAYLHAVGELTLGAIYLIVQYTALLGGNLSKITRQAQDFQSAAASVVRVTALRREIPRIVDGGGPPLGRGALGVVFDDVTFGYPTADGSSPPLALRHVSFTIEPGRVLGLIGRTGAGKSTVARLAARLHDVTTGTILLGGSDIRGAHLADLRSRVAYVTQEVHIFAATVRENLTLFDGDVSDERLLAVIDEVGLGDWVAAQPGGLDAEIAGPNALSSGQAQLLQLGRVFLRDPGLVILDEASSRLDPTTERLLAGALERLVANRTAIVIAHRLSTLDKVDDVLVLDEGRVVEHGPRRSLADDSTSRFAELLRIGDPTGVLA